MAAQGRHCRRQDRGESLIELLMTIVILGITVPAIMGAVLISVSSSTQDRRQVQAQALLGSWTEIIARENNSDARYGSCAALPSYAAGSFAPNGLPTGWTATVAITYWDGSAYVSTCNEVGIRKLQLKVAVPVGLYPAFDSTQAVVVRKLCLAC